LALEAAGTEQRKLRYQVPHARERSIMTRRLPPVPPASRSPKGPGDQAEPPTATDGKRGDQAPENLKEQDRQDNIKQNTTNQGYQQDR
jgi:hypothetical protein